MHNRDLSNRKKEQEEESLFKEWMAENSPNLWKEIDIQVQEKQSSKQDELKEICTKMYYN